MVRRNYSSFIVVTLTLCDESAKALSASSLSGQWKTRKPANWLRRFKPHREIMSTSSSEENAIAVGWIVHDPCWRLPISTSKNVSTLPLYRRSNNSLKDWPTWHMLPLETNEDQPSKSKGGAESDLHPDANVLPGRITRARDLLRLVDS